jgi:hypothetical protein
MTWVSVRQAGQPLQLLLVLVLLVCVLLVEWLGASVMQWLLRAFVEASGRAMLLLWWLLLLLLLLRWWLPCQGM